MRITATRYHDISTGHRVYGHESKCAHLHGHNYRIHFTIAADSDELDSVGRVLDFSVIKELLCMWVENNWDHKFLIYFVDPLANMLKSQDPLGVVTTTFNPTAENMAEFLVEVVGPDVLPAGVTLVECIIEETAKCRVSYKKDV